MRLLRKILVTAIGLAFAGGLAAWFLTYRPGSVSDGLLGFSGLLAGAIRAPVTATLWLLSFALGIGAVIARYGARRLGRGETGAGAQRAAESAGAATEENRRVARLRARLQPLLGERPDIIALVDALVDGGLALDASDIHVEPAGGSSRVLFRLHGLMVPVVDLEARLHPSLMNRLKVMTRLVSYVSDRPQDGRFLATGPRGQADVRVSILPTNHGEKAVLRLAAASLGTLSVASLGISAHAAQRLGGVLARSQGLIYVTGPTGSGKTRTIYAALGQIKQERSAAVQIASIEDPIESDLPFIAQTQVHTEVGLTFAAGLRSILRQDPNVLLVGEIRDPETARIAVQAGLSGHLILTTVHAESAAGVFNRLIDMDVEPFLVASASLVSVAQRLVRALCAECRAAAEPSAEERTRLTQLGVPEIRSAFKAVGCSRCDGQGFVGRTPLVEVLEVTPAIRDQIVAKIPTGRIHEAAVRDGMRPLLEDGLDRAASGQTTLSEVLRVVG